MATSEMSTAAVLGVGIPDEPTIAGLPQQPQGIYGRETFIFSARWMAFIRETEGDEVVDAVLKGCTVLPWSFSKTGGGSVEEGGNSIKIVLESTLTDREIGEKMAQLFELFERAETRQMATQNKPVKFQLTEHILFKNEVSGYVIGKGGNNLWNIKQFTGVDLLVVDDGRKQTEPKPDGFDRLIINGTSSFYVHHARYQVQHLFDQASNISTSPDIPHYTVPTPPAQDPYYSGATATSYFGGGMGAGIPPPPGSHMLQPHVPSAPGIFTSPSPLSTMPSSLKRPRVDAFSPLNGSVLPKVGAENGGTKSSTVLSLPPATIKAVMEKVGEQFDAIKSQIEESLGGLVNECSQNHLKELQDRLMEKDAEIDQLKKDKELERQKLMCLGCNAEERDVLFTGCRHLLFCVFCAGKYNTCPHCGMAVGEDSKLTVDRAVGEQKYNPHDGTAGQPAAI